MNIKMLRDKINECDYTYLTPKIDGDDYGGTNYIIRVHSKNLPNILSVEERQKLNYRLHEYDEDSVFQWFYEESYENMDYNGAFLSARYIDKDNEFNIDTVIDELDWLIDGDYIDAIVSCLSDSKNYL